MNSQTPDIERKTIKLRTIRPAKPASGHLDVAIGNYFGMASNAAKLFTALVAQLDQMSAQLQILDKGKGNGDLGRVRDAYDKASRDVEEIARRFR